MVQYIHMYPLTVGAPRAHRAVQLVPSRAHKPPQSLSGPARVPVFVLYYHTKNEIQ